MSYEVTFGAGEANHLLDFLNNLIKEKKYVFRGYGKQEQLLPSIIREGNKYVENEKEMLYQLERQGSKYFTANSPVEFMSFGQHFGLPTRLLDFTYNPFIALYFALSDNKGTSGPDKDYYYLLYANMDENIVIDALPLVKTIEGVSFSDNAFALKAFDTITSLEKMWRDKSKDLDFYLVYLLKHVIDKTITKEQLKKKVEENKILFVSPNFSNERIMAQQGLFMFPYTLNKEAHLRIIEANTNHIKIHKKLRNELMDYLDIIGFNSYHLMPDLASVCFSIKKSIVKQRESESEAKISKLEERLEPYRIMASDIKSISGSDISNLNILLAEYEKLGRTILDSRINESKDAINHILEEYYNYTDYIAD